MMSAQQTLSPILVEVIVDCLTTCSKKSIIKSTSWAKERAEFERAIITRVNRKNNKYIFVDLVNHSYKKDWIDLYVSNKFIDVDPVIIYSEEYNEPFQWSEIYQKDQTPNVQNFIEFSGDYGLESGASYRFEPIRLTDRMDFMLFNITNMEHRNADVAYFIMKSLLPVYYHILSSRNNLIKNDICLSKKEVAILSWASSGKTSWEIGRIIGISECTVKYHLRNIYQKLNVNNRSFAIARAISLGLI